ncbi:N-acetyltransferase family protein [Providencia vermicola]|uniref:GNAT family N-acetyltransferase n=1 Tax=Providencia TaxID=586 RepID=UPI0012B5A0D7|nr:MULTISPECIES: GNAT family N-acetyltransferase [unclassified Providencia]MTB39002.1 GNAT family N-acetyltransferase [Providencia sp. wls1949]MTC08340.1 GNAT family N-acetyltransferase [Providencia sp. wls1948]
MFRLATPPDIASLIQLDSVTTAERAQKISQWVNNKHCYLIEQQNQIIAYGVLHYQFFEYAFIEMIMVNQAFRQQGTGLSLLQQLKQTCLTQKIFTSTNQSNTPMQRLLDKAQFKPSGFIDNLDEGDPELIYFCQLA